MNEALCRAIGDRAVGLMGDELGLRATQLPALGLVGDPQPYAPPRLRKLMDAGRIPVVAPLARGPLNVNGDEAAAALALGLHAERIVFLTDVEGLYLDRAEAPRRRHGDARRCARRDRRHLARRVKLGLLPVALSVAVVARLPVVAGVRLITGGGGGAVGLVLPLGRDGRART